LTCGMLTQGRTGRDEMSTTLQVCDWWIRNRTTHLFLVIQAVMSRIRNPLHILVSGWMA